MIKEVGSGGQGEPRPLEGSIRTVKAGRRGIELVVRLTNPGDRALHYIGLPRAILYDPPTRRLTVRLSDQGRIPIPGGLYLLPAFRVIDPVSEAEIRIDLPPTIVKLAEGASAPGDIAMEEHTVSKAAEIALEIAWSDTPFYQDPRVDDHHEAPAGRWQKGVLRISHRLGGEPGRK